MKTIRRSPRHPKKAKYAVVRNRKVVGTFSFEPKPGHFPYLRPEEVRRIVDPPRNPSAKKLDKNYKALADHIRGRKSFGIRTIERTASMPETAQYVRTVKISKGKESQWFHATLPTVGGDIRRIVDPKPKPAKKAGRKMIRMWYFYDRLGLAIMNDEEYIRKWHKNSANRCFGPGPIESALIPEPRKKVSKTK